MSNIKPPQKKPYLIRKDRPTLRQRINILKGINLVEEIRNHKLLGRGTNSVVDQYFSDKEIVEELDREKITTTIQAFKHFALWEDINNEDLMAADEKHESQYFDNENEFNNFDNEDEFNNFDNEPCWWSEWPKE